MIMKQNYMMDMIRVRQKGGVIATKKLVISH